MSPSIRISALALLLGMLAAPAAAQDRDAVRGCYAPPTGLIYVVGEPGTPEACLDSRHVALDLTAPAPAILGAQGNGGDGNSGGKGGGTPGGAPVMPSGGVMHFDLDACPAGWTELEAARGRALTGLPQGGTRGGLVGDPLADLEDRSHGHSIAEAVATAMVGGGHDHTVSGGEVSTTPAGRHNHQWTRLRHITTNDGPFGTPVGRWVWDTWQQSGALLELDRWGDGIGAEGGGHTPVSIPNRDRTGRGFYTQKTGDHQHTLDLSETQTGQAGQHTHDVAIAAQSTSSATTSAIMPYLQLLVCRKD